MQSRFLTPGSTQLVVDGRLPLDRPFRAAQVDATPQELAELVRRGYLRRVVRGVYVASAVRDTLSLRARALSLVVPTGAVVTDRTAAWLHGVDVLLPGEHQTVPAVHIFHRVEGNRLRRPEVSSGQRMMPDSDVLEIDGVVVTTPVRTACDLGRDRNRDRAFAGLEAMVRAGVDKEEVLAAVPRFTGYRWVRRLRAFAPLVDQRPDSIAESITRLRWLDTCPPYPEPQRPVLGPSGEPWRLDLGVDALWFAVEYDGAEFHDHEAAQAHDTSRRAWIEKNTPWMIRVVTKENIFGPAQDFHILLPRWIAEARRTLGERLGRPRWYDVIGD
jgi:hypothetical protein